MKNCSEERTYTSQQAYPGSRIPKNPDVPTKDTDPKKE